jgi:hypothetical protein
MSKLEKSLEEARLLPAPLENQLSFFSQLSLSEKGQSWTFETDRLLSYRLGKRVAAASMDADVQEIRLKDQTVKILRAPAALFSPNGKSTLMFPSDREYWVEKALRKLAIQQSIKVTLLAGEGLQVVFTIYALRKELSQSGHFFTPAQIKESLEILAGSQFKITCESNQRIHGQIGTLLEHLSWNYKPEDEDGKKSFVRCHYHPMVAQSIRAELHHPINHERQMSLKNTLSAWLVDRINQAFRQAERPSLLKEGRAYNISLSTILNESGMIRQTEVRFNLRTVRAGLKALAAQGYLDVGGNGHPEGWVEKPQLEQTSGRPKITDTVFDIYLSADFATEIIEGNIIKKTKVTATQPGLLK